MHAGVGHVMSMQGLPAIKQRTLLEAGTKIWCKVSALEPTDPKMKSPNNKDKWLHHKADDDGKSFTQYYKLVFESDSGEYVTLVVGAQGREQPVDPATGNRRPDTFQITGARHIKSIIMAMFDIQKDDSPDLASHINQLKDENATEWKKFCSGEYPAVRITVGVAMMPPGQNGVQMARNTAAYVANAQAAASTPGLQLEYTPVKSDQATRAQKRTRDEF